jgi:hypothetical protein
VQGWRAGSGHLYSSPQADWGMVSHVNPERLATRCRTRYRVGNVGGSREEPLNEFSVCANRSKLLFMLPPVSGKKAVEGWEVVLWEETRVGEKKVEDSRGMRKCL